MSNNQTPDYYIAPKGSFDATAEAIRTVTGSQASITWGQNGFADAIDTVADAYISGTVANVKSNTTTVRDYAFNGCANLTSVILPEATTVGTTRTFEGCSSLSNIVMDKWEGKTSGSYMFNNCTSLTSITSVNFPNVSNLYVQNCFGNCTNLQVFCLPKLGTGTIPYLYSPFNGCSNLEAADLAVLRRITGNTFKDCAKLTAVVLRYTSVATLDNVSAFTGTPFAQGGTGGTIYIPKSLYDHIDDGTSSDYKAATNWVTLDGYGTITWAKIEGSYYENYYPGGIPINGNGTNLLSNSEHFDPSASPFINSDVELATVNFKDGENSYHASAAHYVQVDFPSLTNGYPYTISFDVCRNGVGAVWVTYLGTKTNVGNTVQNEWARLSYTFYASSSSKSVRIQLVTTTAGGADYTAAFRRFKLEQGVSATSWS